MTLLPVFLIRNSQHMSKRALKKYTNDLKKKELEAQLVDLYDRFPVVKEYYDFVFNPKEDKLVQEAKTKISNEYYPLKRKRARARRSPPAATPPGTSSSP